MIARTCLTNLRQNVFRHKNACARWMHYNAISSQNSSENGTDPPKILITGKVKAMRKIFDVIE